MPKIIPSCRVGRLNAMLLILGQVALAACSDGNGAVGPSDRALPEAAAQASVQDLRNGTSAIMDIVAAATAAWNAKDAAAYAAPYSEDVVVINPLGATLSGRSVFQAQHVFLFGGPFAGSTLSIAVTDIDFLTGTLALVYQDVTVTGYAFLPPGLPSQNGVVSTRVTWVVAKRGGTWTIISQQMTPRL